MSCKCYPQKTEEGAESISNNEKWGTISFELVLTREPCFSHAEWGINIFPQRTERCIKERGGGGVCVCVFGPQFSHFVAPLPSVIKDRSLILSYLCHFLQKYSYSWENKPTFYREGYTLYFIS